MMSKKEDYFYKKLKKSLLETTDFPSDYMYKFIIPNQLKQKQQIESIFDFEGAVIKTKRSKSDKYLSVTAIVKVNTPNEIIKKYKEAAKIKGIISL